MRCLAISQSGRRQAAWRAFALNVRPSLEAQRVARRSRSFGGILKLGVDATLITEEGCP